MLNVNTTFGVDPVILPESDDGTFGPIDLPTYGFPFWNSDRETAYVRSIHILLSVNILLFIAFPIQDFNQWTTCV